MSAGWSWCPAIHPPNPPVQGGTLRGCDYFIVPITLRVISAVQKPLVLRQHHTECDGYFLRIKKNQSLSKPLRALAMVVGSLANGASDSHALRASERGNRIDTL